MDVIRFRTRIMNNKCHVNLYRPVILFLTLLFLINAGCQHGRAGIQGEKSPAYDIENIVVVGFKPAVYQGEDADDTSVSISFEKSPADSALLEKSYFMTSRLFDLMTEHEGYDLISPDRAEEALSRIAASEPGISDLEIAGMVAREFQADGVVIGCLYRWKDREGSDYAARNPASVFFDLCLVIPDDASIIWKGRFNKTQRSLSENILDIKTFLKGKGKWMTADDLAGLGLNDLVKDMFLFMNKEKEAEN